MNLHQKKYELALSKIAGIGPVLSKQLISYCGSAETIFKLPKGKLLKVPNIGDKIASEIQKFQDWNAIEKELLLLEKYSIQLLSYTDDAYPFRLKQIPDAPTLLYYKGNACLNAKKVIAIVGTRSATSYGKEIVKHLISELSQISDIIVISGLAYGIDIAAHKACLEYDLPTIGVLGSGLDVIYPPAHKPIADEMLQKGGLLSELPLRTPPEASHFPVRNRIIAGMSDAIIVVEAAKNGGALITANLAFEYNREVFACPGSLLSTYSEGCHLLISSQKAHIFSGIKQFLEIMQWNTTHKTSKSTLKIELSNFSEEERQILIQLQSKDLHIDELSVRTQISINRLASILLSLEMDGWIKALPGKKFALNQSRL
ncbi:MAG: DNA-processing protein DprA [Cytophagales bacterium]|nr:DNA-processing protein DprA [Cytophagales bacterium]MDW8384801.1 DNA-processing protein DprA [Flammeovirgaceae bacterium]